jgi:hypothetical protein
MTRSSATKTPYVERVLLTIMGPADVLDPDTPPHPYTLAEDICVHCGQPRRTHPVTRDPKLGSISTCPAL